MRYALRCVTGPCNAEEPSVYAASGMDMRYALPALRLISINLSVYLNTIHGPLR